MGANRSRLTTGEAVAKSLVLHGVDTMFGIPGAHLYHFTDALARESDRIEFITTRHEQGAGHMAFGHAKSTGRPGVYTVVPGPGVLNSSSALCVAYGANAPVLCVTGNIMSNLIGRGRGQLPRAARPARDTAELHGLGGAYRPPDRGSPHRGPGVSGNACRTDTARRDRSAVGRVRPVRRGRSRDGPGHPGAALSRPGPDRRGGKAGPRSEEPDDRGGRGRTARARGGRRARRARPGTGHQLPQRQGRGGQRQSLWPALRRRLRVLAEVRPADRHRQPTGARALPLALGARRHQDRPHRHRSDRTGAHSRRCGHRHRREARDRRPGRSARTDHRQATLARGRIPRIQQGRRAGDRDRAAACRVPQGDPRRAASGRFPGRGDHPGRIRGPLCISGLRPSAVRDMRLSGESGLRVPDRGRRQDRQSRQVRRVDHRGRWIHVRRSRSSRRRSSTGSTW